MTQCQRRIFFGVTTLFWLAWIFLAIDVRSRDVWILENLLVVLFAYPVTRAYLNGRFSLSSYGLVVAFATLHCVGAHFTYSFVPYDKAAEDLFGFSINQFFDWQRNHFDRFIHFLWGLMLFVPVREWISGTTRFSGKWLTAFSVFALVTVSAVYEILEWVAASLFDIGIGVAYTGAQGDPWDAQKDQALALAGIFVAWLVFKIMSGNTSLSSRYLERDSAPTGVGK